jgi:hypothetical protein
VIETNRGAEQLVFQDRPLVWGDDGGRHRRLIGGCEVFAADTPEYQGSRYGPVRRIASRRASAIEGHFAGRICGKQN